MQKFLLGKSNSRKVGSKQEQYAVNGSKFDCSLFNVKFLI
jgi:hypothetical protein